MKLLKVIIRMQLNNVTRSSPRSRAMAGHAPAIIVTSGCVIAILTFGPRSTMGFFLQPMSNDHLWGRDVFALAIALQHLVWGIGQPLAGAIADRFGAVRSLCLGAGFYAAGLLLMAYASIPALLLCAGALIGFGLSGASFNIVLAAFSKLLPPEKRSLATGIGSAAGSFGQFLFSPLTVGLLSVYGWHATLLVFSALMVFILPLSLPLDTSVPPKDARSELVQSLSFRKVLAEALRHPSYILLLFGFFSCGFHVAFINMHLPPYLVDKGLDVQWGGWVIALIGVFNILGSIGAGWLSGHYPKRYILSSIYFLRSAVFLSFVLTPMTPTMAIVFGAAVGLLWLSTIPPTSGLVAVMFGTRYMATLFGFVFFAHQLGAFAGVWLGGVLYEQFGSYDAVWWLCVAIGLFAGLVNLPIAERPIERAVPANA